MCDMILCDVTDNDNIDDDHADDDYFIDYDGSGGGGQATAIGSNRNMFGFAIQLTFFICKNCQEQIEELAALRLI